MPPYTPFAFRLRTALALLDAAALVVAVWIAFLLRFAPGERAAKWDELLARPGLLVWVVLVGWALAAAAELYEPEVLNRRRETMLRVLAMLGGWSVAVVFATYLRPSWAFGRGLLLLTTGGLAVHLIVSRWLFSAWMRRRPRFRALVVGDRETVARFCARLSARPSSPWEPVDAAHLPPDEIPAEIAESGAAVVVLAGSEESTGAMGRDLIALHFSGVPVVAASEVWAWLEERLPLDALPPAVFLHQPGFGGVHWTLFNRTTRVADVALAAVLLVVSAPLLLLAAVAVVLDDGFPVLFRQERAGQYGRPFTMLKLRTMRRDAETDGRPAFASEDDPRVTRVGAVLRRFRLDELPQLWNVLKGEMSLVGPRPERPEFVAQLSREIEYYAYRTAVPPGLTGWAQVNTSYARELEDHRRKLEFDLYFIRERSMRLYLLTLLRTVSAALSPR